MSECIDLVSASEELSVLVLVLSRGQISISRGGSNSTSALLVRPPVKPLAGTTTDRTNDEPLVNSRDDYLLYCCIKGLSFMQTCSYFGFACLLLDASGNIDNDRTVPYLALFGFAKLMALFLFMYAVVCCVCFPASCNLSSESDTLVLAHPRDFGVRLHVHQNDPAIAQPSLWV